jgi:hypothetical protein
MGRVSPTSPLGWRRRGAFGDSYVPQVTSL